MSEIWFNVFLDFSPDIIQKVMKVSIHLLQNFSKQKRIVMDYFSQGYTMQLLHIQI